MYNFFLKYNPINSINNLIASLFYSYIYAYIYKNYLDADWGYMMRMDYVAMSNFQLLLYMIVSSIPFLFYRGASNIAAVFSLFVYTFVYIPFLNSLFVYNFPEIVRFSYIIVFLIIMSSFFYFDKFVLYKKKIENIKPLFKFKIIEVLTIFLFLIILLVNTHELRFVNFFSDAKDLYEFREDANINLIYILCWIRSALLPVLMVYYMYNRHILKFLLCVLGFVLIFMIDKQKMTIIFPIAITAIMLIGRTADIRFARYFHIILFLVFTIIPFILVCYKDNPICSIIAMIFILRIQCIAGMQIVRYLDFFIVDDHPFTYYSHVGLINKITGMYPYKESIGQAISMDDSNSNATFLLMDGVSACGIVGCVIIAILFIYMKSILNTLDAKYGVPMLTAMFLFPLQSLMNVSLFTSFFTHGIFLSFLVLIFCKIGIKIRNC